MQLQNLYCGSCSFNLLQAHKKFSLRGRVPLKVLKLNSMVLDVQFYRFIVVTHDKVHCLLVSGLLDCVWKGAIYCPVTWINDSVLPCSFLRTSWQIFIVVVQTGYDGKNFGQTISPTLTN